MLRIQVLGKGMIPRGLGLAPRMEPFPADRHLIATILNTPSMSINYLHPENGKLFPLTRQNMRVVLEKYGKANYEALKKVETTAPHTPENEKKDDVPPTEPPKNENSTTTPPPAPPTPPAQTHVTEPPKPVTPPQPTQPPVKPEPPKPAQETKPEEKKDEVKKEEPKKEEPKTDVKPGEKKEDKPAAPGGLKPVVGQGPNAQK